jgi:hypothetical protein
MKRAFEIAAILLAGVLLGASAVLIGQQYNPPDVHTPERVPLAFSTDMLAEQLLLQARQPAPVSWPELCTLNHSPTNPRVVRLFCAPGVLNVPSATPTSGSGSSPTPTLIPTNTPRPTATNTKPPTKTKTATETGDDEFDTPTPENEIPTDEPLPPTLGPGKTCELKVIVSGGIRVRKEPTRGSVQLGYVTYPNQPTIDAFTVTPYFDPTLKRTYNELWAHSKVSSTITGWFVVVTKLGMSDVQPEWWVGGVEGHSEICMDVQGWPSGVLPPEPIVINENPAGLHVLGGFSNTGEILRHISAYNILKVTDDAAYLMSEAKRLNPAVITIHRNIFLVSLGLRNCPDGWGVGDPIGSARNWWNVQVATWSARGLWGQGNPVDFREYRNECGFAAQWEVAFDKEIIRLANNAGVCLAIQSYAYGQPEPEQYATLAPVLDAILAQECAPGRRHIIAAHTYGNVQSGIFIFGRWQLFRAAVGSKYDSIQWVFSEFGVSNQQGNNDGRGSPDCPRAALETRQAVDEYRKHPEVLGFSLYSVGSGTEWLDLTPCLGQIAAALQ